MLQGLADRLGIGLKHPVIQRNIPCPPELQGALWWVGVSPGTLLLSWRVCAACPPEACSTFITSDDATIVATLACAQVKLCAAQAGGSCTLVCAQGKELCCQGVQIPLLCGQGVHRRHQHGEHEQLQAFVYLPPSSNGGLLQSSPSGQNAAEPMKQELLEATHKSVKALHILGST